jgi:hypothetical protein
MTRTDVLDYLATRMINRRQRVMVEDSWQQHVRNGRGFWPAVMVDGEVQVVRFASSDGAGSRDPRWTPETGRIELVPVNQLSPSDLPRVRFLH